MADDSNCLICLESLYDPSQTLGVTTCGHPIHAECFRGWEKSRSNRDSTYGRRKVSCPTCNTVGVEFIKVFMPLPGAMVEDDHDDDSSVSSLESNANEENVELEKESNVEEPNSEDSNNNNDDEEENSVEEVPANIRVDEDVVDLTATNDDDDNINKKEQTESTTRTDKEKNYRRRLKKYKRQLKQCESKFHECHKKQQELFLTHKSTSETLAQANISMQEQEQKHADERLHLFHITKENATLARLLGESQERSEKAEKQLKTAQKAIETQKKMHTEEMKRAKDFKSAEQKKIMEDHPKLLERIKQLQEELQRERKSFETIKAKIHLVANHKHRQELEEEVKLIELKKSGGLKSNSRQLRKELEIANQMSDQNQTAILQRKNKRPRADLQSTAARAGASARAQKMKDQAAALKRPKKARISSGGIDGIFANVERKGGRNSNGPSPLMNVTSAKKSRASGTATGNFSTSTSTSSNRLGSSTGGAMTKSTGTTKPKTASEIDSIFNNIEDRGNAKHSFNLGSKRKQNNLPRHPYGKRSTGTSAPVGRSNDIRSMFRAQK